MISSQLIAFSYGEKLNFTQILHAPWSRVLLEYLGTKSGRQEIKVLHKIAVLDTAHLPRKVLMQKYKTYFTGEITLQIATAVNTEQLKHYIP